MRMISVHDGFKTLRKEIHIYSTARKVTQIPIQDFNKLIKAIALV